MYSKTYLGPKSRDHKALVRNRLVFKITVFFGLEPRTLPIELLNFESGRDQENFWNSGREKRTDLKVDRKSSGQCIPDCGMILG